VQVYVRFLLNLRGRDIKVAPQYNVQSMLHPRVQHLSGELEVVLDEAVKLVDFIKSNSTN
jgi:hypothetical protein